MTRHKGLSAAEHIELGDRLRAILAEVEAIRPTLLRAYGCKFETAYCGVHKQLHKLRTQLETQLASEGGPALNVYGEWPNEEIEGATP
jgi:hypothetical protein